MYVFITTGWSLVCDIATETIECLNSDESQTKEFMIEPRHSRIEHIETRWVWKNWRTETFTRKDCVELFANKIKKYNQIFQLTPSLTLSTYILYMLYFSKYLHIN